MLNEGLLDRVELAVFCQSLDGKDIVTCGADGQNGAGVDSPAIEEDGAGAAETILAASTGTGESQVIAEDVQQQTFWWYVKGVGLAIDLKLNVMQCRHVISLRFFVQGLQEGPAGEDSDHFVAVVSGGIGIGHGSGVIHGGLGSLFDNGAVEALAL